MTLDFSLVSVNHSAAYGNLKDKHHMMWTGDFTGCRRCQALFYYSGNSQWILGTMERDKLTWRCIDPSGEFGNLCDGRHPAWTGDFKGSGQSQVLFTYSQDGHWWLGEILEGQLTWKLVYQQNRYANLLDNRHLTWAEDFTGDGRTQVLCYSSVDSQWNLGEMQGENLNWSCVGDTTGAGSFCDGRHKLWIGDFTGCGHSQLLLFYTVNNGWLLGSMQGNRLVWNNAGTIGFGDLLDGKHPVLIGDFTSCGHSQILFNYSEDGHWWLGEVLEGQLTWNLVDEISRYGNFLDGHHLLWSGDFTGCIHSQVLFYYSGNSEWVLGEMKGNSLHWTGMGNTSGLDNLCDGKHQVWIGDFRGSGHFQALFQQGYSLWMLVDLKKSVPINQSIDLIDLFPHL